MLPINLEQWIPDRALHRFLHPFQFAGDPVRGWRDNDQPTCL